MRGWLFVFAWVTGWVAASACGQDLAFACMSDAQCEGAGAGPGRCEVDGRCSFADNSCPSGRRYAEHSGPVSNRCVGVQGAAGTGTSAGSGDAWASGGPQSNTGTTSFGTGVADSDADTDSTTDIGPLPSASTTEANSTGTSMDGAQTDTDPGDPTPITDEYVDCDDPNCGGSCLSVNMSHRICGVDCFEDETCPTYVHEGTPYPLDCWTQFGGDDGLCLLACDAGGGCPGTSQCTTFLGSDICMYLIPG